MDYKKLLSNRNLRIWLIQCMDFVPDSIMVRVQYKIKTGRKLNLANPKRYTEKLQWYKLYYRDALMSQCVDKYKVRQYIAECGCEDLLNQLYGVYDRFDQISFAELPERFVIKDTLGGGGNSVILCHDKQNLDLQKLENDIRRWQHKTQRKHPGREWVYDNGDNRIIIEKMIDSNVEAGGLIDYKFFCFNGKVSYLYVIADREVGDKAGIAVYDRDYRRINCMRVDEKALERTIPKPGNFEQMVSLAEKIAKPFPHARVDFYNPDGKIIFGEITFFDGSGYMKYDPDEFDFELGEKFILPVKNYKA